MEKAALLSDLQNVEVSRMKYIYEAASDELRADRDVVITMVSRQGTFLHQCVPELLRSDKEVVLAAVRQRGGELQYVADFLKDDLEVVKAAITGPNYGAAYAIQYASGRLRGDRQVTLLAVAQDGEALQYCDEKFRNDPQVVLAAINCKPKFYYSCSPLEYVSCEDVKRDRDLILQAVAQTGKAIEDAPLDIVKNDREIMLTAVKTYGEALGYASGHLPKTPRHDPFGDIVGGDYTVYERYWKEHPDPVPPDEQVDNSLANDREIVLAAVTNSAQAFKYASKNLRGDKEIAMEAVKKWGSALEQASSSLQDDRDIVLASVINDGDSLAFASERLRGDGEIVATALACCTVCLGSDLQTHFIPYENVSSGEVFDFEEAALMSIAKGRPSVSPRLRSDKNFALRAVDIDGDALRMFDENMRKDREVVEAAIARSASAARYSLLGEETVTEKWKKYVTSHPLNISNVPKDIPDYKDVVLAAIAVDGKAFKNVLGTQLKDDKDFILKAVQIEGEKTTKDNRVLELASQRLKDDRDVVMAAVQRKPRSFRHASARLRSDPEIALLAAECYGGFSYASAELKSSKKVAMEAIQKNPSNFSCVAGHLRSDIEVVMTAVQADGACLRLASKELQSNREVVKAAVRNNGLALEFADPAFRHDREIVLLAVKNRGEALKYASSELCADKDIVNAAIENDSSAMKWANVKDLIVSTRKSTKDTTNDTKSVGSTPNERDQLLQAMKSNTFSLHDASDAMKDDEEVITEALKISYQNVKYASKRVCAIKAVALAAVEAKYSNIRWVSRNCLMDSAFLSELAAKARQGVLRDIQNKRKKR